MSIVESAKKPAMSRQQALVYMFVTALIWSTGGVLVKFIEANPFTISCVRALVALPVLLLIHKPRTLRFTKKVWISAGFFAAVGILFVLATKLTTAANAIILEYSSPIFIVIINRLIYRESVRKADVFVSIGCFLGMVLFFLDKLTPGNMLGNFLAILSGLANAAVFVSMSRTTEDRGSINVAAQIETIAVTLPFLFLFPPVFTLKMAVAMLLLGGVQRALSGALYAKSAPHCSAMDAILISMAEPLFNPLLVMLAFGEKPGKFALLGSLVVIASVLLWNMVKIKSVLNAKRQSL